MNVIIETTTEGIENIPVGTGSTLYTRVCVKSETGVFVRSLMLRNPCSIADLSKYLEKLAHELKIQDLGASESPVVPHVLLTKKEYYQMKAKGHSQRYWQCECCGSLIVTNIQDSAKGYQCPSCHISKCEHGGQYREIPLLEFCREANIVSA